MMLVIGTLSMEILKNKEFKPLTGSMLSVNSPGLIMMSLLLSKMLKMLVLVSDVKVVFIHLLENQSITALVLPSTSTLLNNKFSSKMEGLLIKLKLLGLILPIWIFKSKSEETNITFGSITSIK